MFINIHNTFRYQSIKKNKTLIISSPQLTWVILLCVLIKNNENEIKQRM